MDSALSHFGRDLHPRPLHSSHLNTADTVVSPKRSKHYQPPASFHPHTSIIRRRDWPQISAGLAWNPLKPLQRSLALGLCLHDRHHFLVNPCIDNIGHRASGANTYYTSASRVFPPFESLNSLPYDRGRFGALIYLFPQ